MIALTDTSIAAHPGLEKLRAQGHTVYVLGDALPSGVTPHLVIGPSAWYMDAAHLDKYLDLALKAARKRAYPGEPEEAESEQTGHTVPS